MDQSRAGRTGKRPAPRPPRTARAIYRTSSGRFREPCSTAAQLRRACSSYIWAGQPANRTPAAAHDKTASRRMLATLPFPKLGGRGSQEPNQFLLLRSACHPRPRTATAACQQIATPRPSLPVAAPQNLASHRLPPLPLCQGRLHVDIEGGGVGAGARVPAMRP